MLRSPPLPRGRAGMEEKEQKVFSNPRKSALSLSLTYLPNVCFIGGCIEDQVCLYIQFCCAGLIMIQINVFH